MSLTEALQAPAPPAPFIGVLGGAGAGLAAAFWSWGHPAGRWLPRLGTPLLLDVLCCGVTGNLVPFKPESHEGPQLGRSAFLQTWRTWQLGTGSLDLGTEGTSGCFMSHAGSVKAGGLEGHPTFTVVFPHGAVRSPRTSAWNPVAL